MLGWFLRSPSKVKADKGQLEEVKRETKKQRLLLKEALEQLGRARANVLVTEPKHDAD